MGAQAISAQRSTKVHASECPDMDPCKLTSVSNLSVWSGSKRSRYFLRQLLIFVHLRHVFVYSWSHNDSTALGQLMWMAMRDAEVVRSPTALPGLKRWTLDGKLLILHIGKTGGSALKDAVVPWLNWNRAFFIADREAWPSGVKDQLWQGDVLRGCLARRFAFVVRAPLRRFVSSWVSRWRSDRPAWNNPWSRVEADVFRTFQSPDQVGCALSSENRSLRRAAVKAMQGVGHVRDTMLNYLGGSLSVVERCARSILFVGRLERIDEDWPKLARILDESYAWQVHPRPWMSRKHASPSTFNILAKLGPCAYGNLMEWYRMDYELLALLVKLGSLPADYLHLVGRQDAELLR